MEDFEWAQNNLAVETPQELQERGVNVYFAPNIRPAAKVVSLASGQIDTFQEGEDRPQRGYYGDFDGLVRYCERNGTPLIETNGQVFVQGTPRVVAPDTQDLATNDSAARSTHENQSGRNKDLRGYGTAYDCRDRLPELTSWMSDDLLKQILIWKGARFERGQMYFDLDNPERGAFVATGDEGFITDHTYASRTEVSPEAWAQLVTWRQPVSEDQARAIDLQAR